MIPPIANRFVAGETPDEALDYASELNDRGMTAILNLLGEHYDEREPADDDADSYLELIDMIAERDVEACISVKPSQIGLFVSEKVFRENFDRIVEKAREDDVFVWLDMEDHTTTDATIDAYLDAVSDYLDVGICLQANLKRTPKDLERVAGTPGKIRLVKGAYDPPEGIGHSDKTRVNAAYRENLEYMFENFDARIAVGTHDMEMVEYADELSDEYDKDFEVQMLMGVRQQLQYDLAGEYEMYQYVPYGGKWMSYFYRRIRERKENLVFAMRAIVSG
ncbi:MAG: proline dehydrogenase family protein [Halobacteria archaeon]|nr:proline dehydrogenase family protein [Halobacteria archaeon]